MKFFGEVFNRRVLMGFAAPIFLSGLLFATATGCTSRDAGTARLQNQDTRQLHEVGTPFTFAVLGDSRKDGDVYRAIAGTVASRGPAFVINTGDVMNRPGDAEGWADFVTGSAPLTMPYFIVPGNHDVDDAESEAAFRGFVEHPGNELYYSFEAGGSLFVILDSEQPGRVSKIDGVQLDWLKGVLRGSDARFKFVFVHRPLYPDPKVGRHYGDSLNVYGLERDALQRLFEDTRVSAVIAGHEHLYLRKTVGGVTHVITGGAGAPLYGDEGEGGFHHFVEFRVDKDAASAKVIDIDGNVKDEFIIMGKNTG